MKTRCAIVWLVLLAISACTVGQTGEEDPGPQCRSEVTPLASDERAPIGIVPADFFAKLQSGDSVYDAVWGADARQGEAVAVTFTPRGARPQALPAPAADGAHEAGCPDFITLELTLELESLEGATFSERLNATAKVFQDGSGIVDASLPKEELRGTFGSGGVAPSGNEFERLAVRLALGNGAVTALLITAESDERNRTSEIVASWP